MTPRTLHPEFVLQRTSLKDLAEQSIRKAIFEGQLAQGKIYPELMLAKTLQISVTPVREALINLAAKELLTRVHRKGFKIRQFSDKEVKDIFDYREMLETTIISRVVPKISNQEVAELEQILADNTQLKDDNGESHDFLTMGSLFHLRLAELCGSPCFRRALERIGDLCDLAGVGAFRANGGATDAHREHQMILSKIKRRATAGAADKMKKHLRADCQRILQSL